MTLFNNKYRIETTRLSAWDYGANALYFITICTKYREHFFGEVINDEMILNDTGMIAQCEWQQTPTIRPDMNLTLDEFVVMPNHFHAIIHIGSNGYNSQKGLTDAENYKNSFSPQAKNLASVIRGFKSAVTKHANKIIDNFKWQDRFHDHIIRNEETYLHIRDYILNNPQHWEKDKFYIK